jgi:hypothetical protein
LYRIIDIYCIGIIDILLKQKEKEKEKGTRLRTWMDTTGK